MLITNVVYWGVGIMDCVAIRGGRCENEVGWQSKGVGNEQRTKFEPMMREA